MWQYYLVLLSKNRSAAALSDSDVRACVQQSKRRWMCDHDGSRTASDMFQVFCHRSSISIISLIYVTTSRNTSSLTEIGPNRNHDHTYSYVVELRRFGYTKEAGSLGFAKFDYRDMQWYWCINAIHSAECTHRLSLPSCTARLTRSRAEIDRYQRVCGPTMIQCMLTFGLVLYIDWEERQYCLQVKAGKSTALYRCKNREF